MMFDEQHTNKSKDDRDEDLTTKEISNRSPSPPPKRQKTHHSSPQQNMNSSPRNITSTTPTSTTTTTSTPNGSPNNHKSTSTKQSKLGSPTPPRSGSPNLSAVDTSGVTPFGFRRDQLLRIISQALTDLGCSETVKQLQQETHIQTHSSPFSQALTSHVMHGDWDTLVSLLQSSEVLDHMEDSLSANGSKLGVVELRSGVSKEQVVLTVLRHKYRESIATNNTKLAVSCLQQQIVPLLSNTQQKQQRPKLKNSKVNDSAAHAHPTVEEDVKDLAMMLLSDAMLAKDHPKQTATHNTKAPTHISAKRTQPTIAHKSPSTTAPTAPTHQLQEGRKKLLTELQGYFPPSLILPENRLESLLHTAIQKQIEQCPNYSNHARETPLQTTLQTKPALQPRTRTTTATTTTTTTTATQTAQHPLVPPLPLAHTGHTPQTQRSRVVVSPHARNTARQQQHQQNTTVPTPTPQQTQTPWLDLIEDHACTTQQQNVTDHSPHSNHHHRHLHHTEHTHSGHSRMAHTQLRLHQNAIPTDCLDVLDVHTDEVWCLEYSPCGEFLASASRDGCIILWHVVNNYQMKRNVKAHEGRINCIAFSPNSKMLLTCATDCRVCLWDCATFHLTKTFSHHTEPVTAVSWVSSTSFVSSSLDKSLVLVDIHDGEQHRWHGISMHDVCASSDGTFVAALPFEKHILLIDLVSLDDTPLRIPCDDLMTSVHVSRNSKHIVVNSTNETDAEVLVFGRETRRLEQRLGGHMHRKFVIRSRIGGPDGAYVASGSEDGKVFVWCHESGERVSTLLGHTGCVNCVAWHPSQNGTLASASDDNTIRVWGAEEIVL